MTLLRTCRALAIACLLACLALGAARAQGIEGALERFKADSFADTEQAIAEVWRDVLGIERIGIHDNFFDIGGHSLLAVRVITRIDKRLGVRLNQANMVLQTLEQLAAECAKRLVSAPAAST